MFRAEQPPAVAAPMMAAKPMERPMLSLFDLAILVIVIAAVPFLIRAGR